MTTLRRCLVRPTPPARPADPQQQRLLQRRRAALAKERSALARWTRRLKLAFQAFERCHREVARLEKLIRSMEESA
jgi:hypothetical protein